MAKRKRTWVVAAVSGWISLATLGTAAEPAPGSSSTPRSTNDSQAAAIDLLRRVIKEQQQNPSKIVRSPVVPGSPGAVAGPRADRAELERQFLDGRISAKEFQRAMEELEKNPPPPPKTAAKTQGKDPALSPKGVSNLPGKIVTNAPATVISSPEDAPEHKTLTDVEAKIDEILARRRAQVEAAKTNTPPPPTGPLTKRQKLDGLLRSLIQGKMTEAEYNAERDKVLAQPD